MNMKHIIVGLSFILIASLAYITREYIQLKHGAPDLESRIIIENNTTRHIEEGDVLVVEEIIGGTIILVPEDQSNLIN